MYKQIEALAVPAKGMIELSTMVFATLARNLIMYPVLSAKTTNFAQNFAQKF